MKKIVLSVHNLYKYFGNDEVLKNINLEINQGEVIAILGPSGSGKSTLLRCLNGLETIQQGSIQLNGQELNNHKSMWAIARQRIGMVFQHYDLFPHMNVINNILLGPLKVQKRNKVEVMSQADALLSKVGLMGKKKSYPRELSGGEKQRIAIIRALCMNPDIMLFDEVTASLDPEMVKEVLEVIRELANQGMTMLIATHELNFAKRIANHIVFIDQGSIIEITPPDIFFNHPTSLRAQQFLSVFNF